MSDYYDHDRSELLEFIPPSTVALDVGCSSGNFGGLLKEKVCKEVWGIEIDEASAKRAEEKLDKVFSGPVEAKLPECPDQYFDLICFNDVIEHLVDPEQVLLDTKKKLKPGGKILCSIPNIRYFRVLIALFFFKEFEYQDAGVLDRTHLRFFTNKSILKMMDRLDYKMLIFKGMGSTRSWKYKMLNFFTLGLSYDSKFEKYVCLIEPK